MKKNEKDGISDLISFCEMSLIELLFQLQIMILLIIKLGK
jgi:hypothetical protein